MFKRLSIFALTLVLTLGILAVPALAACNHVHDAPASGKRLSVIEGPAQKKNTRTRKMLHFPWWCRHRDSLPEDAHTHIDGKRYIDRVRWSGTRGA